MKNSEHGDKQQRCEYFENWSKMVKNGEKKSEKAVTKLEGGWGAGVQ